MRKDVRLTVLEKSSDGWWKGEEEGTGRKGWFPSNYVRENEAENPQRNGGAATAKSNGIGHGRQPPQQRGQSPAKVLEVLFRK